jgi:hypothetical protein
MFGKRGYAYASCGGCQLAEVGAAAFSGHRVHPCAPIAAGLRDEIVGKG